MKVSIWIPATMEIPDTEIPLLVDRIQFHGHLEDTDRIHLASLVGEYLWQAPRPCSLLGWLAEKIQVDCNFQIDEEDNHERSIEEWRSQSQ